MQSHGNCNVVIIASQAKGESKYLMHSILHGDCLALLPTIADNSIDAIVTDPPYCLSQSKNLPIYGGGKSSKRDKVRAGFMGKAWDDDIAFRPDVWRECLRVLKPGGHIAVFGGSRTHHRVWVAVEDAGFEIRDTLMWLYGSGFPKSLDVSKAIDKADGRMGAITPNTGKWQGGNGFGAGMSMYAKQGEETVPVPHTPCSPEAQQWQGWGTALKPSHEPILLARKPLIGTVAQNVLAHGTGALNIDASRVPTTDRLQVSASEGVPFGCHYEKGTGAKYRTDTAGRWPPNLLHDGSEEVVECFPSLHGSGNKKDINTGTDATYDASSYHVSYAGRANRDYGGASGSAARFFPALGYSDDERRVMYCPKASRKDRNGSKHPTVKPIKLIEWLCTLICPPNGTILDPFAGSGTTGQAAMNLGFDVIMIEREAEYYNDILKRVSWPPLPADAP